MPTIRFLLAGGEELAVEALNGRSLMETALENSVPGIVAECNGSAACATCHVVLPDQIMSALGPISEHENDMLDFAEAPREAGSRLSCQIKVSDILDNVAVRIPSA
ncbi:MAG: 2Fe-2S iron-sulfur cluster binding domain-containing protein [Mesorhizobium sp.]|nr:2Fe-2S iron-sulfur cluster binding domain-containing protein [bacterium M00.F.Ca.ET.205.01.1.1]TGU46657.1 2Fe-2S iron-sulfur cluster binding domain-containing protein [bacterium M00.F.Ca.ET.152.01.1.1]TGV31750.1 2Fe-2S iron-sulfur cluster binding domain-containing protein [Mesorhizobium sp. M00.F.Ca.ET.186.01.1.1]TGZ38927.1 2Fe-2S iron-sulfur cluster binding domain-containing protein [bacterium M00.F.Ca.ET.162.01.1.1]TJW32335.1 MAG: 2Fe-2S iron-sulfur cluster binding domain-containing protei